jgi:hypothetical protein
MKLAQLVEDVSRGRLLKLQQYLLDHLQGKFDIKLGKHDNGKLCLFITYFTMGLEPKLELILEHDGWQLYVYESREDEWRAVTGSNNSQDDADIAAEVQSYTYGPQG